MCIEKSVGENGVNARGDVAIVQVLLNFNRPVPSPAVEVDGLIGKGTIDAIREFQSRMLKIAKPDGRVDAGGGALAALVAGLPPYVPSLPVSEMILRGILPLSTGAKIGLYAPGLRTGMANRAINTKLRQAHFLAQLGHESMSFVYAEEIASGEAYEGRKDLGNTQTGDGKRFKGRGLIQLTGRTNYTNYATNIGKDLMTGDNPKLVATDASLAVDAACWFWSTRNLNDLADTDNIMGITRIVNGGLNGLADRQAYLRRAKVFFGI